MPEEPETASQKQPVRSTQPGTASQKQPVRSSQSEAPSQERPVRNSQSEAASQKQPVRNSQSEAASQKRPARNGQYVAPSALWAVRLMCRAETNDCFGCRLIYQLFFQLVTIILAASVSTLVLPHILRANEKPMKQTFENIIF